MKKLQYIFSCEKSGRPYARGHEDATNYRTKDNACVVLDGTRIIYAGETERFSKVKHDFAKPTEVFRALTSSPKFKDVQLEDLDACIVSPDKHEETSSSKSQDAQLEDFNI